MQKIIIDGKETSARDGTTVLAVAESLGIEIPTLCNLPDLPPFTSCMVCVVEDMNSHSIIPSCSSTAESGMIIDTQSERVREARKCALELLLSEHVGDCEAPCRRTCPASMNIPQMIRQIKAGQLREALITVKEHIPLPAVLGRICSAPCEKGCRRGKHDAAVGICLLKRYVADIDLESNQPFLPSCLPSTGKRIAIIGSGPTGLSTAYYLQRDGHTCTIFDKMKEAGGALRYGVSEDILPQRILDAEIDIIKQLGVEFKMDTPVNKPDSVSDLASQFDAVVIATGRMDLQKDNWHSGIAMTSHGIEIKKGIFSTDLPGIYAGGGAVRPLKMAVRSVGDGRSIALSISAFFAGKDSLLMKRFDSRMGRLADGDINEFLKEADLSLRVVPVDSGGYSRQEVVTEAGRCLHCDCRDTETCKLRQYSDEYGAKQSVFKSSDRRSFSKDCSHKDIIFESGKCIKCGICVRIAAFEKESLGLAFQERGFSTEVGVPFGESLAAGLRKSAERYAESCPTGALANNT